MDRRGFLRGILAAGMAPAVVKAGILMPVKKIIVTEPIVTEPWYAPAGLLRGEVGTIYGMSFTTDAFAKDLHEMAKRKGFMRSLLKKDSFSPKPIFIHPEDYIDYMGKRV